MNFFVLGYQTIGIYVFKRRRNCIFDYKFTIEVILRNLLFRENFIDQF